MERCHAVSDEIQGGQLPFDRIGCYFDEVLMGAALSPARDMLKDMPDLFASIPPSFTSVPSDDDEDEASYHVGDDDWDCLSDHFDDEPRWEWWEVPILNDHPMLASILATHHPFNWFDPIPVDHPLPPGVTVLTAEDTTESST